MSSITMRLFYILIALFLFVSCEDNEASRKEAQLKELQKEELQFNKINKSWNFTPIVFSPKANAELKNWEEWRQFINELSQKPKSSMGAFQIKAKLLSKKIEAVLTTLPEYFNKPEIKSRLVVLKTKINSLDLFINLDDIPDQKVIILIGEINTELMSIQNQVDEIVRKSEIPMEQGEADMIRMLDTSRAVKNVPKTLE